MRWIVGRQCSPANRWMSSSRLTNMRRLILTLSILPIFAGKPPAPKPNIPVPAAFRNQPAGAEVAAGPQWWKEFGDPLLDDLVDRAGRANLDVRRAASRLGEVQQNRNISRAALLPTLDN